jgi:hypothetical protein
MSELEKLYENYRSAFIGHEDIPGIYWFEQELKTNSEFRKRFGISKEQNEQH